MSVLVCLLALVRFASAHNPRFDPPEPLSVPEAWNVVHQCIDNVGALLDTRQLDEIPYQVADCSLGIRVLQAHAGELPNGDDVNAQLDALYGQGGSIITSARDTQDPRGKALRAYNDYRAALKEIESHYKPEVLNAEIYICPMHPLDRHMSAADRCSVCNMSLVRRRIVASSVYEKPGEPSMKIAATADHPLEVGKAATVRVTIKRNSGQPVTRDDLLVV
ncbi:MAG TPA: hypothetical protein VLJ39_04995, partial [Tepidisphaeraceae bacterium]|nr:hypothetical protein [Tepidisphaeraceae bacterium]